MRFTGHEGLAVCATGNFWVPYQPRLTASRMGAAKSGRLGRANYGRALSTQLKGGPEVDVFLVQVVSA